MIRISLAFNSEIFISQLSSLDFQYRRRISIEQREPCPLSNDVLTVWTTFTYAALTLSVIYDVCATLFSPILDPLSLFAFSFSA